MVLRWPDRLAAFMSGIARASDDEDLDDDTQKTAPAFVLELYPSEEQRGVAGRFIAEAREKRRSGAGVLSPEDHWMLESLSLPGGVNLPRLRWARKRRARSKDGGSSCRCFRHVRVSCRARRLRSNRQSRPLLCVWSAFLLRAGILEHSLTSVAQYHFVLK